MEELRERAHPCHARLVMLGGMLLLLYVAGIASVTCLVLFARPRHFGLVALARLTLALWHGLYLALLAPGTFSLDAPFTWLYVWLTATALVLLPIALRTWIPS